MGSKRVSLTVMVIYAVEVGCKDAKGNQEKAGVDGDL
jgi:hypothetical protein